MIFTYLVIILNFSHKNYIWRIEGEPSKVHVSQFPPDQFPSSSRGPHRPSRPASPAGPSGVPSGAVRDWPSGASGGSVLRPRLVRGPVQRRPKLGTARPARPAVRSTVRDKSAPSEARPRPVRSPIPAVRGPSEAQSGPVRGPSAAPFFASGGVSDGRPAGRDGRWGPLLECRK